MRAAPVLALGAVIVVVGIIVILTVGTGGAERQLVRRYVDAWARGNYARMYAMLDSASQRHVSLARFTAAYQSAAATATLISVTPVHVGNLSGGAVPVRMRVQTRAFGTLRQPLEVPVSGSGANAKVRFSSALVFPGLHGRQVLSRHTTLGTRGTLLASDGTPLAQGPGRTSPIPDVAAQIVGTLGPIPRQDAGSYAMHGYPPGAKVGQDGLERIFENQLAGTPGGTLRAGRRVLARSAPGPGQTVHTTINPDIERAAIAAMGGRYAGIAAMAPRSGAVLALAGVAFSALQPPGSTMKVITATGALAAHIVKLGTTFPIRTSSVIGGYTLENANGEACGGTFLNAFAVSCNSVFAPLGVKLGAKRLVSIAERFGFNQPSSIPGAGESTIPSASTMGSAVDVGSSAIGQGKVLTSALQMTDVAATIADGGRRPIPTLQAHARPQFVLVTSHQVAHEVQRMMIAVVQFGTGTAAQIPGVTVAGKTGTAELRNTTSGPGAGSAANTDAWFIGYAPVRHPRIVVGALFPEQGAGGATAAPAVRQVLLAGLHAGH